VPGKPFTKTDMAHNMRPDSLSRIDIPDALGWQIIVMVYEGEERMRGLLGLYHSYATKKQKETSGG
jgi:hypothetical protein